MIVNSTSNFIIKTSASLRTKKKDSIISSRSQSTRADPDLEHNVNVIGKVWNSVRHPKEAGINTPTHINFIIPLIAVPALIVGLVARFFRDQNLSKLETPDQLSSALANIYPPAYTLLMICGTLNGAGLASPSRVLSYSLLLAGALYLWNIENKRKNALEELAKLKASGKLTPEKEKELKNQAAEATAGISAFSRIFYGFAMYFTFWAMLTQSSKHKDLFECYKPSANADFKTWINGIQEHFWKNGRKEKDAGLHYFKELFNPSSVKNNIGALLGQDQEFEAKLTTDGVPEKSWKRPLLRLGHPEVNCSFTMLNGVLRLISVVGTAIAVANLGGMQVFNNGDKLLGNPDLEREAQEKPAWKNLFDSMMSLNNIGLFFMGICSLSTGLNNAYISSSGSVAATLQIIGASLTLFSAILDQLSYFLPGQAVKLGSNGAFQLSNIFSAVHKMSGSTASGLTSRQYL